jgi:hypothetical protein
VVLNAAGQRRDWGIGRSVSFIQKIEELAQRKSGEPQRTTEFYIIVSLR